MTIQLPEPNAELAVASPQDVAVQRLGEWAQSAEAAWSVAQRLSRSSFVPFQFRGKPEELTAAILAGLEVGLSPMAAARSFDIIQGQAAPRAITLRAIAQAAGHELVLVESTSTRCRMKGRRRGSSEWQHVTWTMDRARELGLAGKDNWRQQPAAMLVARATSELARLIASDAILGIGYSSEELEDGGPVDTQQGDAPAETPSGTRRMRRRTAAQAEQVQTPSEPQNDAPEGDSEPRLLDTQSNLAKAMYASLHEAGITEPERLPFVASVIGREVTSSKEMTEDEARMVLRALDQGRDDEPVDAEVVE